MDKEFYINYVLLGNPHTRALNKKFNRSHQIQEKISINFRTTLSALAEYFEKIFFIPLEVVSGNKVLGAAELKLDKLIQFNGLTDFLEKNPLNFYEFEDVCLIKTLQDLQSHTNRPMLEYKMTIKYIATKKLHQTEYLESYQRSQSVDFQGGGDQPRLEEKVSPPKRRALSDIAEVQTESSDSHKGKTLGAPKSSCTKIPENSTAITKPSTSASHPSDIDMILNASQKGEVSELPRIFSYNLQLGSIKFNKRPEKGVWQLSFYHDKADTPRTFFNMEIKETDIAKDNSIAFEDVELKLFFTSYTSDIMEIVKSSELCTFCVKGPRKTHAKAQLDCNSLMVGSKEKANGSILLHDKAEHVTAMATIFVCLEDLGINFNARHSENVHTEMNVTKTIEEQKLMLMDENYSYKIIEELEDWKAKEQDSFLVDIKKRETFFLNQMKEAWQQKQSKYEQELISRTDKLQILTQSLEDARNNLKDKQQQSLQEMKNDIEKSYNDQLIVIKERARRIEDDLLHEMKLKDIRFLEIERCNEHLKAENYRLHQEYACVQAELQELKANLIPKAEVEKLLQEMVRFHDKLF